MSWRRWMIVAVCTLAFGSLAVGCSDDDSNGGGSGYSVDEPEDFSSEFETLSARGLCTGVFECPEKQNQGTLLALSGFDDQESCEDYLSDVDGLFAGTFDEEITAVDEGRTTYSSQAAEECLEDIDESIDQCISFEKISLTHGACSGVFEGEKEEDEACIVSGECDSGVCEPSSDPDVCYGNCTAPGTAGEGESCAPGDCDLDEELSCSGPEGSGECVAPESVSDGDSCLTSSQCEEGTLCVENVCTEVSEPGGEDDTCTLTQTSVEACEGGLTCQDLAANSETGELEGVCASPLEEGDSCMEGIECQPGLFCDGGSITEGREGECAPVTEIGETCEGESSRECGTFGECVDVDGEMTCRPAGEDSDAEQCELPDE
ncbi:MAG: hypothetical protein ACOCV2_09285 [Persicimonas sp.]